MPGHLLPKEKIKLLSCGIFERYTHVLIKKLYNPCGYEVGWGWGWGWGGVGASVVNTESCWHVYLLEKVVYECGNIWDENKNNAK